MNLYFVSKDNQQEKDLMNLNAFQKKEVRKGAGVEKKTHHLQAITESCFQQDKRNIQSLDNENHDMAIAMSSSRADSVLG